MRSRVISLLILAVSATGCIGSKRTPASTSPALSVTSLSLVSYTTTTATLSVGGTALGTTMTGNTQLTFYTDSTCTGNSVGIGTAQTFQTTGIEIQVPAATPSTIFVLPNTTTQCFQLTEYVPNYGAPPIPVFNTFSPTSPSITVYTPRIFGTAASPASNIQFFSDVACTQMVGSGLASDFIGNGIVVTLTQNQTTSVYAESIEPFGHTSACTLMASYTQNSNLPAAPTFTSIAPASPSRSSVTPTIVGAAVPSIVTVNIFSDPACTQSLGTGTATAFTSAGISVTVVANASTNLYAQGVDTSSNDSPCGYLTTFVNDTMPPTAPAFTASNPASPTRLTIFPAIQGTCSSDATNVDLFSDAACTVEIGDGTSTLFQTTGITVTVGANATTSIYAESLDAAGNPSACTLMVNFINNTVPPDPPSFSDTIPASPNNQSTTPLVQGTVDAPIITTVSLFSDPICTSQIGTGTATTFGSTGIQVGVTPNTTTTIYGESIDNVGNVSTCALLTTYAHSTLAAPSPAYTTTIPTSPSRTTASPYVVGTVAASVAAVTLYSDVTCSTQVGNGTRASFVSGGINVFLPLNATTPVYAMSTDIYSNLSPCTFMTNFTHDNIPPADPTFTSITPTSPTNVSGTPTVTGTASVDTVTLNLYDSNSCTSILGTGTGGSFPGGIVATVALNGSTTIYAKAFDAAGNGSNCIYMSTYIYDILKPGKPNFVSATPPSPSYSQNALIKGTVSGSLDFEPVVAVNLYTDSLCSSSLATGIPGVFTSTGIAIVAPENAITSIYGQTADAVGNLSTCQLLVIYNENDNGPADLMASQLNDGAITLNWDVDPNAADYIVKRSLWSGGPYIIVSPANPGPSYIDTAVNQGVTYYYVVDATNATGTTHDSSQASITINVNGPDTPSNLTATAANGFVQLNWVSDSTEMSFNVYRGTQSGGAYQLIASNLATNSYQDLTVSNGTSYFYVVNASNPTGTSPFSNEASTVPETLPPPPINFTGRWNGSNFVVSWEATTYYTAFNIKVGPTPSNLSTVATVSANTFTYSYNPPYYTTSSYYFSGEYYAVTGVWGSSESPLSNEVGFKNILPSSVTLAPGNNEMDISWSSLAGAVNYQVWKSTVPGGPYTTVNTTAGTSYIDSAVTNGTAYFYVIVGDYTGAGMYGQTSSEVNAIPGPNTLGAPTNLILTTVSNLPDLTWSTPNQFDFFNVYRSSTLGGPYTKINPGPVYSANYLDPAPLAGINYYEVTSTWGSYETSPSSVVFFRNAPISAFTATGGTNSVSLSWSAVASASSYNVFRATSSIGPFTLLSSTVGTNSYPDTAVTVNQGYFYEVSANFADGTTGQLSAVKNAMVGSSHIPSGVTITQTTSSSMNLNWVAVVGATSYKIYKSTAPGGPYTYLGTSTPTNAMTVASLSIATIYYFEVTSVVSGVESSPSAPAVSAETAAIPAAPSVTPGNNSVSVLWNSVTGAATYTLSRSTDGVNFTPIAVGLTAITYLDTTAVNGTLYFYTITPIFTGVSTTFSSPASYGVTPGVIPLTPAGLVVSANAGGGNVTLSWAGVPAATSYNIKQATVSGGPYTTVANVPTTIGNGVTGLTPNQTYYFVVSALIGSVESANSAEISVVPQTQPPAPTVIVVNNTSIRVTWNVVSCGGANAISYDVLRASDQYDYVTIATGLVGTTYSDMIFTTGYGYTYEYLPHCAGGVTGALSAASTIPVTPGVAALVPQSLTANTSALGSVNLSWLSVPDVVSYNVYRATASGGPYSLIASSSIPSYMNTGLGGGSYYYVVTSVNGSGVESTYSNEASVTFTIAAPASLSATPAPASVQLSWASSGGASSYSVKRGVSSGGPYGVIASGLAGTTYTDSTTQPGITYYYVVTANSATGVTSPDSPEASAAPTPAVNIQVPIELTDQSLSSSTTAVAFARTQTSLDTTAYDGTITYSLEIVAFNGDSSARNVTLVDASSATVGTINVPTSASAATRFIAPFTPDVGLTSYKLQLDGTTVANQLQVLSARMLVTQTQASKTKIYIPLLASSNAPSFGDVTSPVESTASTSYYPVDSGSLYTRNSSVFSTLAQENAWELEALVAANNGAVGAVVLYDATQSLIVNDTETLFNSSAVTLTDAPFNEGIGNFSSANEGDTYQIALACTSGCSSGTVSIYKAGLWVTLKNLTQAEVTFRNALASAVSGSTTINQERAMIDLTKFSNPQVYFQAVADPGAGSSTIQLDADSAFDSGLTSLTTVSGSALSFTTAGKAESRSGALTITSGNRFVPNVSIGSGTTQFNNSAVVVDVVGP